MEILAIAPLSEAEARGSRSRVHSMKVAHHTMAALCARGLKDTEVARVTNRSAPTIRNFRLSPAGAQLIEELRGEVSEEILSEVEYRLSLRRRATTLASERLVERLLDPGHEFSNGNLLAIMADTDDRTGLGKQSTQVNLNIDMKSRLIEARKRIEGLDRARQDGMVIEYVRRLP